MADLRLTTQGDLPPASSHVRGPELVAQRMTIRSRLFRGECPLDTDRGLDYLKWAGAHPIPIAQIRAQVIDQLSSTPGLVRLIGVSVKADGQLVRISGQGELADRSVVELTGTLGPGEEAYSRVVVLSYIIGGI